MCMLSIAVFFGKVLLYLHTIQGARVSLQRGESSEVLPSLSAVLHKIILCGENFRFSILIYDIVLVPCNILHKKHFKRIITLSTSFAYIFSQEPLIEVGFTLK